MHSSTTTVLTTVLFIASGVNGFWRMPCRGRTGLARIDPLVDFGVASEHVHAIHGSSGFSPTATTDDLLAGDCTSCGVEEDKSAYWHPALYFQKSSGEFQVVPQIGGMLAYYLLEPRDAKLKAFPKGFEMLAGDTYQRNFTYPVPDVEKSAWTGELQTQAFLSQWALGFNCLNYQTNPEPSLYRHFLPDKAYLDAHCTDGIRLELAFPSCWDGKNLDGINHDKKSHVAYPNLGNAGTCPDGFPVRTISLFYETIWNTYAFNGQDGRFVLANGDPTGYGYHADFIMGWDEDFLQKATDTCQNPSGQIEDCPIFTLQSEDKMDQCELPTTAGDGVMAKVMKETVDDTNALPGDVEIQAGPAYAKGAAPDKSDAPTKAAEVPTLTHSDAPTIAPAEGYLPGAVLKETSVSAKADFGIAAVATTAPPQSPSQAANTQSYFKTEYKTRGSEVVEVLWVEEVVTVTAESVVTTTVVGAKERRRHLQKHRRGGSLIR